MKKAIFMSMLACVASLVLSGCHKDDEPESKKEQTKVTVKYNFIQSFDLHNAVDVEIKYYDLETGKLETSVLPAEVKDGEASVLLEDNDTLACGFILTFKRNKDFVPEDGRTYDLKFDYKVDVITEQPGKDIGMTSDEGYPFNYSEVTAENMEHIVELIEEVDDVRMEWVVKKFDDTFVFFNAELFK